MKSQSIASILCLVLTASVLGACAGGPQTSAGTTGQDAYYYENMVFDRFGQPAFTGDTVTATPGRTTWLVYQNAMQRPTVALKIHRPRRRASKRLRFRLRFTFAKGGFVTGTYILSGGRGARGNKDLAWILAAPLALGAVGLVVDLLVATTELTYDVAAKAIRKVSEMGDGTVIMEVRRFKYDRRGRLTHVDLLVPTQNRKLRPLSRLQFSYAGNANQPTETRYIKLLK